MNSGCCFLIARQKHLHFDQKIKKFLYKIKKYVLPMCRDQHRDRKAIRSDLYRCPLFQPTSTRPTSEPVETASGEVSQVIRFICHPAAFISLFTSTP
jgi:transposase-like protein